MCSLRPSLQVMAVAWQAADENRMADKSGAGQPRDGQRRRVLQLTERCLASLGGLLAER